MDTVRSSVMGFITWLICMTLTNGQSNTGFNITYTEDTISLTENEHTDIFMNISAFPMTGEYVFSAEVEDETIAYVTNYMTVINFEDCLQSHSSDCVWTVNFTVTGKMLGRTNIRSQVRPLHSSRSPSHSSQDVPPHQVISPPPAESPRSLHSLLFGLHSTGPETALHISQNNIGYVQPYAAAVAVGSDVTQQVRVLRAPSAVDSVFTIVVACGIIINNVGFGCTFDVSKARAIFRKPLPVILGTVLQYGMMPVIAYSMAKATGLSGDYAFGLLTMGCSPGGGFSNVATLVFNGDVTLSLCMTLCNNLAAFAMTPLWLLTLGKTLITDDVTIPFVNIILSLLLLACPLAVGMLFRRCFPSPALKIARVLKPVTLIVTLLTIGLGAYANWYAAIISVSDWRIPISVLLMLYIGLFLAGLMAAAFRMERARVITVAAEVALQNFGVAYIIITNALPQPEADIAAIPPLNSGLYQPSILLPLGCYRLMEMLHRRYKTGQFLHEKQVDDTEGEDCVADVHIGVIENVIFYNTTGTTETTSQTNIVGDDILSKENELPSSKADELNSVVDNGDVTPQVEITRKSNTSPGSSPNASERF